MKTSFALLLLVSSASWAADAAPAAARAAMFNEMNDYSFDIPATTLKEAAQKFADVTDAKIVFGSQDAIGTRTNAVKGTITPDIALQRLLAGTGLTYEIGNLGHIAIQSRGTRSSAPACWRIIGRTDGAHGAPYRRITRADICAISRRGSSLLVTASALA